MIYRLEEIEGIEYHIFNEEITPKYLKYQGKIQTIEKIPNNFYKIREILNYKLLVWIIY